MSDEYSATNVSAKTLMIQGTTSDAGKTTLVAGLCRLFANRALKVAPFKPQNMALNSAVTPCGGEIGRAQALQAKAAYVELDVDFNPILLKPNSDTGAQVIIHGKAITQNKGVMEAEQYHDYKKIAMNAVLESHHRLTEQYQLIVVEGAGSPAEINLREGDIANMGFAETVDCPVIIIADIDKGGVFAHLVGTLMLLSQSEQDRVIGFVINRFRGDISLLESGLTWLEERTNKPVLGVLPYLHGLDISSEDALITQQQLNNKTESKQKVRIVILVFPHMSNHTDFDALRLHPEIDCQFLFAKNPQIAVSIPACDLIILPGSKNVISDLTFLRHQNWHQDIAKHLRYGGKVMGICGGYQMLGQTISDPHHVEGNITYCEALNYFPITTELNTSKTLTNVEGQLYLQQRNVTIRGYEIHAGISQFVNGSKEKYQALLTIEGKKHGLLSDDNQIAGCYLHGFFDTTEALGLIINWLGSDINQAVSVEELENIAINRVSDACQQYLDMEKIEQLLSDWYKC
ncbi:cobyric acid synthase [Candidatus Colwellia aromaticivorans]|uniref:cobyric acid synthase n=1 Tax=Candidatus Colwellia aromaticivorans TaxID=2267621 RepID=UPI000DF4A30E|nr:cobyric acid synthase [Candidatus Colwellia aromaticivorans]